jgi:small subunit ribosomal protein S16
MLRIRLTRVGKKNNPAFRVVVADHKKAVKRKFIEILGHYNPTMEPKELVVNKERVLYWISQGAQASDTMNNLLVDLGILDKKAKINKVYGKPTKKKDLAKKDKEDKPTVAEKEDSETKEAEAVAEETTDQEHQEVSESAGNESEPEIPVAEPETVETPIEEK